jgi:hypothetical protein
MFAIDKLSKTDIMPAVKENGTMDFKALKETVERKRQAKNAAAETLAAQLEADKAEVIGSGPEAVDALKDFLDR